MIKNLVTSFLKHGKITTTLTRAKETQSLAEKMITLAKKRRSACKKTGSFFC